MAASVASTKKHGCSNGAKSAKLPVTMHAGRFAQSLPGNFRHSSIRSPKLQKEWATKTTVGSFAWGKRPQTADQLASKAGGWSPRTNRKSKHSFQTESALAIDSSLTASSPGTQLLAKVVKSANCTPTSRAATRLSPSRGDKANQVSPSRTARTFLTQERFSTLSDTQKLAISAGGGFPAVTQGVWVKAAKGRPAAPSPQSTTVSQAAQLLAAQEPARPPRRQKRPMQRTVSSKVPQPVLQDEMVIRPISAQILSSDKAGPQDTPHLQHPPLGLMRNEPAAPSPDEQVCAWGSGHFDLALDNSLLHVQTGERTVLRASLSPRNIATPRPSSANRLSLKYELDSPRRRNSAVGYSQMLATL